MLIGTMFALAAGLMWGLVFVTPVLLPEVPSALQAFGRYLAFGLIAVPLALADRRRLQLLTRADWLEATKLAAVGNVAYYLFLASSIQRAGVPLPTMLIGTLPVVIALTANGRDLLRGQGLPWRALLPPLGLIVCGIALVNQSELAQLRQQNQFDFQRYASGAALALGAVVCWTWYPIRNAQWMRAHADRSSRSWATAQGVATLPLALIGYAGYWLGSHWGWLDNGGFAMPLGPRPWHFVALMFAVGLLASWLGTLCWNEASQRLPTAVVGQLIVFETLSALTYAYGLRRQWPQPAVLLGVAVLIAGVSWALRGARAALPGEPAPH